MGGSITEPSADAPSDVSLPTKNGAGTQAQHLQCVANCVVGQFVGFNFQAEGATHDLSPESASHRPRVEHCKKLCLSTRWAKQCARIQEKHEDLIGHLGIRRVPLLAIPMHCCNTTNDHILKGAGKGFAKQGTLQRPLDGPSIQNLGVEQPFMQLICVGHGADHRALLPPADRVNEQRVFMVVGGLDGIENLAGHVAAMPCSS